MKNLIQFVFILFVILFMYSCELDNYKAPTASLSGSFIDIETRELIESDIINGTEIELLEHGYENPSATRLIVKVDGTYMNKMLFENTYSIPPIMGGNFKPQDDTIIIDISGSTTLDFEVLPYIRVRDAIITTNGLTVTAKFKLEQTDTLKVSAIGLFAHPEPTVGEPMQMGKKTKSLSRVVDPNEEFTLELKLKAADFEIGKSYFFRIGAVIVAPEAKYNYAKAVRMTL